MRRSVCAALVVALPIAVAACARTQSVTGTVVFPAELPVRTFPRIWVATGHLPYEEHIADEVVSHLRVGSKAKVSRIQLDELEPRRLAGEIPAATVVVLIEAEVEEHWQPRWTTHDRTMCRPPGCSPQGRTHLQNVPAVEGDLTVTAYDGPTARVIDRANVRVLEESWDQGQLRWKVLQQLAHKAEQMMDRRVHVVGVDLLEVDVAAVRKAQSLIEAGDWPGGRQRLEQCIDSPEVQALPEEERARVHYDLGIARRFDPTTMADPEAHFRAAERSLRVALHLDTKRRYADALRELREHRDHLDRVREQVRATENNYRVARFDARAPHPPPGYGNERPEPREPMTASSQE